ncbi:MAG TPA: hypothetical protein VFB43_03245 [Terracidiphilus sp.]|nr:hypothetical protein [Terracidiphilus sp.]
MQVIFSCEDKTYMWWQAELLHHSFVKTGMHAELTAIVAPSAEPQHAFSCNVARVASYAECCPGKPLMVLNKPGGIAEWAALDGPREETVLIVDPDSVFLRAVPDLGPIPDGQAYSEPHDYMGVDIPANKLVIERHCKPLARAAVQPVGIYILINRGALIELARLWLERSIEIAADPVCREALAGTGWLSDMWGYAIAAAELGIHHHLRGFSQVTGSHSLDRPITHYCYPLLADPAHRWAPETQVPLLWSKWHYQPWSEPPNPAASCCEGVNLLEQLRELVVLKRHESVYTSSSHV